MTETSAPYQSVGFDADGLTTYRTGEAAICYDIPKPPAATGLTATQIIYGVREAQRLEDLRRNGPWPMHPALAVLEWDAELSDVHGAGNATFGRNERGSYVQYECVCGAKTDEHATEFDAACELISHALHTCAACHGTKPACNFPRCSDCAF